MHMKYLIPTTLSALLLASPFALAEEAHHQDAGTAQAESRTTLESAPSGAEAQSAAPGGMDMGSSGMMGKGMMARMGDDEDRGGMGMMRCGGEGHGMRERYRELMGRLDLMDARMAKMEALLERLIER